MIEITEILINYQNAPVGIECVEQVGWKFCSNNRNVKQAAYQIQIAGDLNYTEILFDTGRIESGESAHISLVGETLNLISSYRYSIRVRIWTQGQKCSGWKESSFVTGILNRDEWRAKFITAEDESKSAESRAYYFRREFQVQKEIKEAFVHATALGLYHFYINGRKIGEDEFTLGWTSYHKHLLYQTYEITESLKGGSNTAAAMAGAGWYKGDVGSLRVRNHYGKRTAFMCQVEILYCDGSKDRFWTDSDWKGWQSPVLFSEIYDGELYDARLECSGWNQNGYDDCQWKETDVVEVPIENLAAQGSCRVGKRMELPAKRIFSTPQGDTVIDFGQNLTGWISFRIRGKKGDKIELNCFETLDADGNVYLDNLRTAKQTVTYICSGEENGWFHPHFSFQGFQYAKVASYPGKPVIEDFRACVLYSDMKETGKFTCSNPDLNQLYHNIVWGMNGNFLDVPTDCPQRDERLGWTGDAQIFCRTATYLKDTYTFYSKWLRDLEADQTFEGGVPHVVPDIWTGKPVKGKIFEKGTHSAAAWADAAVIIPWTLYLMYGDKAVIRRQYRSMKAWIEFMRRHSRNNIWNYQLQFGDWVALDAEEGSYYGATPNDLTCTAYYAYSTHLFSKMAGVIGEKGDEERYTRLYEEIKDTYQKTFLDQEGRLTVRTQTAHIVSLYFGLLPESSIGRAAEDLIELLRKEGGHLVTGFVGTPYFCHVLSQNGYTKEAYELLLKEDFPSWLYQVKQGATTIWEHWDGKRPDGTMWSPAMNSFNHYAYGAVGEWLYRAMAGIEAVEEDPGFHTVIIRPHVGGGLTYVNASYESIYGKIYSGWQVQKSCITLTVEIPCNTTGVICICDVKAWKQTDGLVFKREESEYRAEAGSGIYQIVYMI